MSTSWHDVNALYQIYPRSFMDANGDGVGDLEGIIEKLAYFKGEETSLGVDAIWLSPIFPSPQDDCGYDVSDYCDIDPLFGDMATFEQLLALAHARGIKVMLDFVPNHSSDQHEWFKQAASSRDNPYRDYYVWKDATSDGSPPNNWLSMAGGAAWTWHEPTQQYYLHSFLPSQPDLNWDNEKVRHEMANVLRFWFDRGVDGFRVDAIWPLSKNFEAGDNPMNPDFYGGDDNYGSYVHVNSKGGTRLYEYLRHMADVAAEYADRLLLFEFYPDDRLGSRLEQYEAVQAIRPGVTSAFYFEGFQTEWWARAYQERFDAFARRHDQLPVATLGNHDQTRIASKYGMAQAKALALMELTLPGMPAVYYGEELGMLDVDINPRDAKDRFDGGAGLDARDRYRTPMRWTKETRGGFSTNTPWLPIGPHREWMNVASQRATEHSFWRMYQKLLRLRHITTALRYGAYDTWREASDETMAYRRTFGKDVYFVVINFTDRHETVALPDVGTVIVSTNASDEWTLSRSEIVLRPFEAVLIRADVPS